MSSEDQGAKPDVPKVIWESGIEVKPVYGPDELQASGGVDGVGSPGEYPFTRGIHPLMYRKRPWTMRQYAGFGTAAETRERFRFLVARGQTGLNVAFDLPTQCGYDSDDPMAEGEVGRVGMAVDTLQDMETAFDGIDLNEITVSLTINGAAVPIMAMYFAMARKRGYDLSTLRGTAQNDILKEFIGRGTWIYPVESSIKLVGDTVEFCAKNAPKYSAVSVCGYHVRESGANPAQEMAYGLSIACAYIDHVLARGIDIDDFAKTLSFNFDIHGNLWEQVAKFRAGRRLWAKILKEKYGAKNPRSMQLRMIAGGGGAGLTIREPENNIMRGAYYGLASALSGTQTMALCSYDEAYTIPTEKAAKLSLRTMQIMMHEIGLCDTVDPLAGSYFVESVTNEMEKRILAVMDEVSADGGIVHGVASGMVQDRVNREAYDHERRLRRGEVPKVGVNMLVDDADAEESVPDIEMHPYREENATSQITALQQIRQEREDATVTARLEAVRAAARADENVMPAVIDAVEVYATVGEVCNALRDVYGAYQEPILPV
ncbi:MAG: methylmalonyl-CoA mutase [Deltaproteobacteria bacterium]|nr:methylmalonyl-CoA mutase [Deltaproteobacteria bacterium]